MLKIVLSLLNEFYHQENSKTPGSVYATYLVSGKQTALDELNRASDRQDDGEDTPMQSSPFMSSPMQRGDNVGGQTCVTVINLVGEEYLEGTDLFLSTLRSTKPKKTHYAY